MVSLYPEARALSDLSWMTAERVQQALREFDTVLARVSKDKGAMGRFARGARAVLPLWTEPGMLWIDRDNPGYLEVDNELRLAMNPLRVLPWWFGRPPEWGRFRGESLERAFLGFIVGLVHHDVAHMLVWIAHQRVPGFHTNWLGEELNCTLWGSTIAHLAVTGEPPDLSRPEVLDSIVEASQLAIRAVHIRDYLNDRASMMNVGPAMAWMFDPSERSQALMQSARELVPEHPAAERAYRRFAAWTLEHKNDPLDGGEVLRWRGHTGRTLLPPLARAVSTGEAHAPASATPATAPTAQRTKTKAVATEVGTTKSPRTPSKVAKVTKAKVAKTKVTKAKVAKAKVTKAQPETAAVARARAKASTAATRAPVAGASKARAATTKAQTASATRSRPRR